MMWLLLVCLRFPLPAPVQMPRFRLAYVTNAVNPLSHWRHVR